MPQKNEERLQKYLAECGVASRRKSEELIAAGKVKVNGHVAQIGDKIDPRRDLVTVRGKKVHWCTTKNILNLIMVSIIKLNLN